MTNLERLNLSRNKITEMKGLESEGTLIDVRAFLYHTIHLRELFSGDGFTSDEDGQKGLKEYMHLIVNWKN